MTTKEFEILALSLRPRLIAAAVRITGNNDEAEDAVQDTMLRLWSLGDRLDDVRSVDALALTITRRLAINALRRMNPGRHIELSDEVSSTPSAEETLIARQRRETDTILASLPDRQRILLRMRHVENYDNATIARLLGSSEGAVRTALSRAPPAGGRHIRTTSAKIISSIYK